MRTYVATIIALVIINQARSHEIRNSNNGKSSSGHWQYYGGSTGGYVSETGGPELQNGPGYWSSGDDVKYTKSVVPFTGPRKAFEGSITWNQGLEESRPLYFKNQPSFDKNTYAKSTVPSQNSWQGDIKHYKVALRGSVSEYTTKYPMNQATYQESSNAKKVIPSQIPWPQYGVYELGFEDATPALRKPQTGYDSIKNSMKIIYSTRPWQQYESSTEGSTNKSSQEAIRYDKKLLSPGTWQEDQQRNTEINSGLGGLGYGFAYDTNLASQDVISNTKKDAPYQSPWQELGFSNEGYISGLGESGLNYGTKSKSGLEVESIYGGTIEEGGDSGILKTISTIKYVPVLVPQPVSSNVPRSYPVLKSHPSSAPVPHPTKLEYKTPVPVQAPQVASVPKSIPSIKLTPVPATFPVDNNDSPHDYGLGSNVKPDSGMDSGYGITFRPVIKIESSTEDTPETNIHASWRTVAGLEYKDSLGSSLSHLSSSKWHQKW